MADRWRLVRVDLHPGEYRPRSDWLSKAGAKHCMRRAQDSMPLNVWGIESESKVRVDDLMRLIDPIAHQHGTERERRALRERAQRVWAAGWHPPDDRS